MSPRGLVLIVVAAVLAGCMMAPMGMMMMEDGASGSKNGGHGGHGAHGADEHAAKAPSATVELETEAERAAVERCASPLATATVTEDVAETPRELRDRQAQLGVPPLARTARRFAEASGCFRLLDADPLLFSLPGAVQPDFLLRVRFVNIELIERSGFERAWHAAYRRAGRYLGHQYVEVEALNAAEIGLALVCPRQRRVAREFAGRDDATADLKGTDLAKSNLERIALAYARAHNAALEFLRTTENPCG